MKPNFARSSPINKPLSNGIHAANSAISPLDLALFSPSARNDSPPLFIFGAPRSGTTLSFQVLTQAFRVTYMPKALDYAHGLTHFFFTVFRRKLAQPQPIFTSDYGNTPGMFSPSEAFGFWRRWFHLSNSEDHEFAQKLSGRRTSELRRQIRALQGHLQAPLLTKCLYLDLAINSIAEALPNALFIRINRDPAAVAASMLRGRKSQSDPTLWWSVRPRGFQTHRHEPIVDQTVWQLATIQNSIDQALATLNPKRWREVSFEHLCLTPANVLNELAYWLAEHGYQRRADSSIPAAFTLPPPPSGSEIETIVRSRYFGDLR